MAEDTGKPENPNDPIVLLSTSMGDIKVELYKEKAPITVENFLAYAKDGFYDGTIFHRVIANFMIQGGGMKPDMTEKATKSPIKNESSNGLQNTKGTLAMARTAVVDSATAQFFINVRDNDFLNKSQAQDGAGYAVFGKVIQGMDVVDKIRNVETTSKGPFEDVPAKAVVIQSVKLVPPAK
jgi:peptidyl-prolyl cis-trans isomerase B (cyclophilin B)